MAVLLTIFVALGAASLLLQGLMYTRQFKLNLGIRVINTILGLLISYITFTSLFEGEMMKKVIAATFGVSALAGLVISILRKDALIGRLLLTLSVIGGIIYLYIGV
ncbi:hypothetical protein [Sporosarcina sp. A2]|uniref:hypothetical protein n=1 Tax=Sporosarcina sp. A2 TaxID=3393449 RepID=UPI003D7AFC47